MALTQIEIQSIIQLIRRDPEVRRQFQDVLQLDGLLEVPSRMDRVEATLERLIESQRRSEARLDRLEETVAKLVEAQQRSEERLSQVEARLERVETRLDRLEEIVTRLAEAQLRTEIEVQAVKTEVVSISDRLRGEEGRRIGEQYERKIERRAPSLFGGGVGGGSQRDEVYYHIQQLLAPLYRTDDLPSEADPMLADIIWWKENRYVVVEVSVRVDRLDVLRAAQRAESLRKVGVDAVGGVIGDEWLAEDTLNLAADEVVEWKVGNAYSPGLLDYRRIAV